MQDSTNDDWRVIGANFRHFASGHADRVLAHLDDTAEFYAEYDAPAFDPNRETFSLADLEPLVRRALAEPKASIYRSDPT